MILCYNNSEVILMNILQKINEDKDYYSFEYYGLNDMATGIEAGTLINKSEEIKGYFQDKELKLNDIDSFIDFMFVKKFIQFKELSPYIKPENKEVFDEMISFLEQINGKYQVKDIIKYVNTNINEIITGSKYHFNKEVFEIAFKYHSGCNKAILYLINNNYYLIVDNFFDIDNIINANDDFKQAMLSANHFDDIKFYRLEEYLKIIGWLKIIKK